MYAGKVRFLQEVGRKAVHEVTRRTPRKKPRGKGVEGVAAEGAHVRLKINKSKCYVHP
jgi:hypothetical protein